MTWLTSMSLDGRYIAAVEEDEVERTVWLARRRVLLDNAEEEEAASRALARKKRRKFKPGLEHTPSVVAEAVETAQLAALAEGCAPVLVGAMVAHSGDVRVVAAAALALCNLVEPPINTDGAEEGGSGAVAPASPRVLGLQQLGQPSHASLKAEARAAAEARALPGVEVVRRAATPADGVRDAMRARSAPATVLAGGSNNHRTRLVECGALVALASCFRPCRRRPRVCWRAAQALGRLATHAEPHTRAYMCQLAARPIVDAMQALPQHRAMQAQGCTALWTMCRASTRLRRLVVECGGAVAATGAVRALPDVGEVQASACRLLVELCVRDAVGRREAVASGAVVAVADACVALHEANMRLGLGREATSAPYNGTDASDVDVWADLGAGGGAAGATSPGGASVASTVSADSMGPHDAGPAHADGSGAAEPPIVVSVSRRRRVGAKRLAAAARAHAHAVAHRAADNGVRWQCAALAALTSDDRGAQAALAGHLPAVDRLATCVELGCGGVGLGPATSLTSAACAAKLVDATLVRDAAAALCQAAVSHGEDVGATAAHHVVERVKAFIASRPAAQVAQPLTVDTAGASIGAPDTEGGDGDASAGTIDVAPSPRLAFRSGAGPAPASAADTAQGEAAPAAPTRMHGALPAMVQALRALRRDGAFVAQACGALASVASFSGFTRSVVHETGAGAAALEALSIQPESGLVAAAVTAL